MQVRKSAITTPVHSGVRMRFGESQSSLQWGCILYVRLTDKSKLRTASNGVNAEEAAGNTCDVPQYGDTLSIYK